LCLAAAGDAWAEPPGGGSHAGWVEMTVQDVSSPEGQSPVVTLSPKGDDRIVPIYIGPNEALAIRLRLSRRAPPRPLTHDLLESVIQGLGGKVTEVRIEDLRENTYIGRIFLVQGTKKLDLDARSSDAIALALGTHAPIYCSRHVLEKAAVRELPEQEEGPPTVPHRRRDAPPPDVPQGI
jgi:bifunctional DNase/RNase